MEPFYIGIDLNDEYAMISHYQTTDSSPVSVSTVAGSEQFQIPTLLAKRHAIGQWYYGDEALRMAKTSEMTCVDNLLRRALNEENIRIEDETYQARELLLLFIQKLLLLSQKLGNPTRCDRLVITVEKLSKENMQLFWWIARELEFDADHFAVIDHKAAFYYFLFHQSKELWTQESYLFFIDHDDLYYYGLRRNQRTLPQVVSIQEGRKTGGGADRDQSFLLLAKELFEGKTISSVYLFGDEFDDSWMNQSLTFLCRGRRVFMGKNLFTWGACYHAAVRDHEADWNYIYMGENEMKFNLSLKVLAKGKPVYHELISAGKNWFEISGECEVILDDSPKINFWKQMPNSREARTETLELSDLPDRPPKTTRLRITAQPIADDKIDIVIRDMGFGEFFRSSGKSWKYTMSL